MSDYLPGMKSSYYLVHRTRKSNMPQHDRTLHMMYAGRCSWPWGIGIEALWCYWEPRSLPIKHNINMAVLDYGIREYFLRLLNPTSAA